MYFGSWKYCPKTFKNFGAILSNLLVLLIFFWISKKSDQIKIVNYENKNN